MTARPDESAVVLPMMALVTAEFAGRRDLVAEIERDVAVPRCRCGSKGITCELDARSRSTGKLTCARCGSYRHPRRWKR